MRKSMAPTTLRNDKITWIDNIQLVMCWMGVLRWRGDAAHSSYDNSVIIRAIQQNQCMGKVGDNNHH